MSEWKRYSDAFGDTRTYKSAQSRYSVRARMTGTFSASESTKTRHFLIKHCQIVENYDSKATVCVLHR